MFSIKKETATQFKNWQAVKKSPFDFNTPGPDPWPGFRDFAERGPYPDHDGGFVVQVTWACPENRVWSHTFTAGGSTGFGGDIKNRPHPRGGAPEVAVWTRDIYKHRVHNSFVIYKYTAVLQVFKFHKKEGKGKGVCVGKTTQRTEQKEKKKTLKENKNETNLD